MNVPYFTKEHLWKSVSDEASPKKFFGGNKPSSKLTLKTKQYHSCGCCDGSQSCEQQQKHVTDKYSEMTLNPNHLQLQEMYVTITKLEGIMSTWCICLTEIQEGKNSKLSDHLNQI